MYSPLQGCVRVRILVFQITLVTADSLERSGKSVVPPSFALPTPATAYTLALAVMPLDGQIPGKILLHNTNKNYT